MDTILSQEELKEVLDTAIREITQNTTGVSLVQSDEPLGEDYCTVHTTFKRGFRSGLSMRTDIAMLTRMAQNFYHKEHPSPQDLEDFATEYFNQLCGRICGALYRLTKRPARFNVPVFHWGLFEPEGQYAQFSLNYSDGSRQTVLIHNVPQDDWQGDGPTGAVSG